MDLEVQVDNVNHPSHYENSCSLECIDVMQVAFGSEYVFVFCLLNVFKYLWRYKNKNGKEDVSKASWYLNKAGEIMGDDKYLSGRLAVMYDRVRDLYDRELAKMEGKIE